MWGVVGASGRTGRVVAEALLAHGAEVRLVVRNESAAASWRARRAEVEMATLEDGGALERAFAGLDGIYLLLPEDPRRSDFHEQRRRMATAMARAVERTGIPHVVVLSTFAAVLPDGNGPASDLHVLEQRLGDVGNVVTTLRGAWFQENVAMGLGAARAQGIFPTLASSSSVRIPTVATKDVGRAAARCLLEPPPSSETVGLAGPAYSPEEMAAVLGAALGRALTVATIPRDAAVETLVAAGLSRAFAIGVVEMQACVESGRVPFHADRWIECSTRMEETVSQLVA